MRNMKLINASMLLSMALLLSACGTSVEQKNEKVETSSTNQDSSIATETKETVGKEDKSLTYALAWELDNLTPMLMSPQGEQASMLVYETLVRYQNGKILPGLAERWEFNEDATELTFYLKQGVTFHDGEAFNAEAVKANLSHQSKNPNAGFMRGISTITNIEVVDEYTVKLKYSAPYFAAINDFVYPDVSAMVSPAVIEEGNFQTMKGVIGTGPYVYDEFVKGSHTTFTRFENYVGEEPLYDKVTIKYIPDSGARLMALEKGEVDFLFASTLMTYDEYQQALTLPNVKGISADTYGNVKNIAVNASGNNLSDIKATADINVRKAIAMSIDKKTIAEGLTYGMDMPATTLFPEGTAYTDVEMNNNWNYNPEKAEQLLEESGWIMNEETGIREKDGAPLELRYLYDSGVDISEAYATAVDAQLAEVGIEVNTEGLEQMQWWMESYSGNYDMSVWNLPGSPETPHSHFTSMLDSNAEYAALLKMEDVQNVYDNINGFLTTADQEKVSGHFDFLLNYINDNVVDIPVSYGKEMIVFNTKKISDYDFYGATHFFDITGLTPAE